MTEIEQDESPATSGVRRSARLSGALAAVCLAGAVVVYAAGGRPYGADVGGGALYLLGLLAGLVASVLLWLTWAELRERISPARLRWGIGTATAALLLVSACTVVSLARVAGGTAQLVLIAVTAAELAGAVLVTRGTPAA